MIFATFYTMGSPYAEYAAAWAKSLDRLGLRYVALGIPPCTWKEAVMQTGEMCQSACRAYPEEVVVFTDVDSEIVRYPYLLTCLPGDKDYDIGVYHLDPGGRFANPPGSRELVNSVVVVWPTDLGRAVVSEWHRLNTTDRDARCADQWNLELAIKNLPAARVFELPNEYCWIADMSEERFGKLDPVIIQHQASRKYGRT